MLGYKHYYEEGFAGGAGFLGIAVALVGRNHPFGVVLAALLFATISQGGLAVNALVPKQIVDVLQAVVIIAVAASVPEVRRLLRAQRSATDGALALPRADAAHRDSVSVRGGGRRDLRARGAHRARRSRATCSAARSAPRVGELLRRQRVGRRARRGSAAARALALLYAVSAIRFRADQVVIGIAINLLAIGVTRFFLRLAFRQLVQLAARAGLRRRAVRERVSSRSSRNPLVWLGIARDSAGRVAAVSNAVRTARARRRRASGGGGVGRRAGDARALRRRRCCRECSRGLGGAYLALDQHQFTDRDDGGPRLHRARRDDLRTVGSGCASASPACSSPRPRRCRSSCRERSSIPSQFVEMIPYVLTIVALAGVVGRAVPPAALGKVSGE